MNRRCRLSISTVAFILFLLGGCTSTAPDQQRKATPPSEPVSDGLLTFRVWNQQTVSENPERKLNSLQLHIEHTGKPGESVILRQLSLKLTRTDRTEQRAEEKLIKVESGKLACMNVSFEGEVSKLEIQAEDNSRKYGPFIYDFALSNSDGKNQLNAFEYTDTIDVSTTQVQFPEDKRCYVDTSLGCLYKIGRMEVAKMGKTSEKVKSFVVLSFKGKGLLQFHREEFAIRNAESDDPYLWNHWAYNWEMVQLPGSAFTGLSPEKGPVLLRDCWYFEVLYEVPENIRRVKLDFNSASKTRISSLRNHMPVGRNDIGQKEERP